MQHGGIAMPMMVSVLVLGASMLALQAAKQTRRPLAEQRTTEHRLDRIEKALKAYWITHQCKDLPPSPAGVVPWVELGLQADDRLDAWGRLITYYQADPVRVDTNGDHTSDVNARWVLVSHGPSGLGAWLPPNGVQRLPFPPVGNKPEFTN